MSTFPDRFWAKVDRRAPDECWPWLASTLPSGYGQIRRGSTTAYAHRVAYELERGPIPYGLVLDHHCRTPACVNPAHLEPVTHRENCARGMAPGQILARAGVCKRGHQLRPGRHPCGKRHACLECRRIRRSEKAA
jgi:hypothetical protein